MFVRASNLVPLTCETIVRPHISLSDPIILLGCLEIPADRLLVVPRNAATIKIHPAKVDPSRNNLLIGCFAIPLQCPPIVARSGAVFGIHSTQAELRPAVSFHCGGAMLQRLGL